ncbi:uncharacterized protein LOC133529906 [Cydia pomonella]|uniref:uncharacterized protein LOC133529906 n=1 Tax=Cydia pomonella TaxID=82600 RepID=UPI002ADE5C25|nr:uncharacterized protein LOC133529906 [Cydia pomonella]
MLRKLPDSGLGTPSGADVSQNAPSLQPGRAPSVGGQKGHGDELPPSGLKTPVTEATVRPKSNASVASNTSKHSKLSQASLNARRLRAEYEAELEVAKLKENLIKKKLALDMADLQLQEEEMDEAAPSVASGEVTARVTRWLDNTPAAAPSRAPAPSLPRTPSPEPLPPLPKSQPLSDIDRLAEAISKLGQKRHVPRQVHEIPTYDGNASDWLGFEKAYRSTSEIHAFKPFENMARLRVALVGEAKAAVRDLLRTATDPEEVMKALEDEFGHPTRLLECALKKVRELPKLSEDGREIRKFTTTVRNCVSILRSIRAEGYLNNPQLVNELLTKLTPYQRAQYGDFAMNMDIDSGVDLRVSPNLSMFVEFLSQITRASSYYAPISVNIASADRAAAGAGHAGPHAGRRDKAAAPVRAGVATHRIHSQVETIATVSKPEHNDNKIACVKCKADHKLNQCTDFKNMPIDERWDLVKQNRLCFKCILKTHSSRYCRAKRCNKCNYSHHDLLHKDVEKATPPTEGPQPNLPSSAPASQVSASETYETLTNAGEISARSLLKVIPVTVTTSAGVEHCIYALLDDGASCSILDDRFASGVDGPTVPLKLRMASDRFANDNNSRKIKVIVRGPNGVNHDISVRTMRNLSLPTQTVPARIFKENAHLRDLDCGEMREAKPMLVLGQDNWSLIVGRELREGKSGRPVSSLTYLGWVVHGPLGAGVSDSEIESANCMTAFDDNNDLHELVKAQFELEAIGISNVLRTNSNSERALEILNKTCRRVSDNAQQWEVGLLWARDHLEMPDN